MAGGPKVIPASFLFILQTMPLAVGPFLKYETVTLALGHQSAASWMSDANYAGGGARGLDVFPEAAPDLVHFLAQVRLVSNRNVRLTIQNHRAGPIGEVHGPDAGDSDLSSRWERGERTGRMASAEECGNRNQHKQDEHPVDANTSGGFAQNALRAMRLHAKQGHNPEYQAEENEQGTGAAQDHEAGAIALHGLVSPKIEGDAEKWSEQAEQGRLPGK